MALKIARSDLVRINEYGEAFYKPIMPFDYLMGGVPGVDYDVVQGVVVEDWPLEIEQAFATVQDYANYLENVATADVSAVSEVSAITGTSEPTMVEVSNFGIIYYDNLVVVAESNRETPIIVEPENAPITDADLDPVDVVEPI